MRCVTGTREGPQIVVDGRTPSYEEVASTARHGARVVLANEAPQAVDPAAPAVLGRGPEFLRRSIRKLFPAWTTTGRAGWTWRRYAATSSSPTTSGAHCAP